MKYHFIMNERSSGKTQMCMAILNSMTESERENFLNRIYGLYADTDSIKVPIYDYLKIMRNDIDIIDEISCENNNDIQHITEAVRLMLISMLSNDDKMIKEGILKQAYEEMTKTTNFDISPFD